MYPLVITILLAAQAYAGSLCYFPNGVQSPDVPCDPNAAVSMCCGSIAACLSNGLCKDESTTNSTGVSYARGTCTDPQWSSPICPQKCQLNQDTPRNSSAFDFRSNGVQMWECNAQGFGTPAEYCCESAAEKTRCCATATARFSLAAASQGNALAVQTPVTKTAAPASSASSTTASDKTATAGGKTTGPTQTGQASIENSNAGPSTTSAKPKGTAAASAPEQVSAVPETSSSSDYNSGGSSGQFTTAAVVGIGVGASAASAIIVIGFVMYLLRRRNARGGGGGSNDGSERGSFYHGPGGPVQAGIVPNRYGQERDVWYDGRSSIAKGGMTKLDMAEIDSIRHSPINKLSSPAMSELESQKVSPMDLKAAQHKSKLFELA